MKRILSAILFVVMALICFFPTKNTDASVLENAKQYNGHYYKYFDNSMPWSKAKIYCERMGGHLVTIGSAEEQRIVEAVISPGKKNLYWIGARRNGNYFVWIDTNKPLEYSNWEPEEPNNNGGNQYAVAMFRQEPLNNYYNYYGLWLDLADAAVPDSYGFYGLSNIGFICEWDSAAAVGGSENKGTAPVNPAHSKKISGVAFPMLEVNIGGITPGQTLTYVEELYGKPDKLLDSGKKKFYLYNDGLFIVIGEKVGGGRENVVTSVICYQDVQQTPSGFKVGTSFKKVVEKYGTVPGYPVNPEKTLFYDRFNLQGCKEYPYTNNTAGLIFVVDKNQIIKAITLLGNLKN